MSYMHIDNLYKTPKILQFKELFAMEKIHGSSAHVGWNKDRPQGQVTFFAGGESHENFVKLFDAEKLAAAFLKTGQPEIVVYGEVYGGRCQGMSGTYGKEMKFVAFEVKIGELFLDVPSANALALELGFEFVSWAKIPTTQEALDSERDKPSVQAERNGMGSDKKREGIVLRPPFEVRLNNGDRLVAKYKRDDFKETATPRPLDQDKLKVLSDAQAVADEWVTEMRLTHVLDAFPNAGIEQTGKVIKAMLEDVLREGAGEIVDSKEVQKAISTKTAGMFKHRIIDQMKTESGLI